MQVVSEQISGGIGQKCSKGQYRSIQRNESEWSKMHRFWPKMKFQPKETDPHPYSSALRWYNFLFVCFNRLFIYVNVYLTSNLTNDGQQKIILMIGWDGPRWSSKPDCYLTKWFKISCGGWNDGWNIFWIYFDFERFKIVTIKFKLERLKFLFGRV